MKKQRALFWPVVLCLALFVPRDTSADESPFIVTPAERAAIVREMARRADIIDAQAEEIERLQKAVQNALLRSVCS